MLDGKQDSGQDKVEHLVAQGRYREAAEAASASQQHGLAADLYERIWEFGAAASCAEEAGDLRRALGNALEAKQEERATRFSLALQAQGEEGMQAALEVLVAKRHFSVAGALAEKLGEREQALRCYQQSQDDLAAARVLVQLGRDRDAGRVLERAIDTLDPCAQRSRASLQLGLLLARRLQHEEAAKRLQQACEHESTRSEAQRALVRELAVLGLRDAARDVLAALHKSDASIPITLEEFLERNQLTAPEPSSSSKRARVVGGRYSLEAPLGAGAAGRVYRARDEVSNKLVAIKLVSGSHSRGSDAYARFAREAKLASSLHHPNLIEVYDFSADQGFLVMELMTGDSLERKIAAGMKGPAVRRMCIDVLSGLALAHQRGIIHRDLKPANIFFDTRGVAKIGDFGVAHLLDLGQTQTGGLIGTLAYMSPEQITGAPLTIAADLYGIGVTLFEALTGRLPFLGPDFVAQHLGEEPPLPSEVSACDSCWDDIVVRLLEKNPGDRYDSIDSLRRELMTLSLQDESKPFAFPDVHKRGPRAKRATSRRMSAQMEAATSPESSEPHKVRYAFETPLGRTQRSTLSRAIDTTLNRSVIIEKFGEALSTEQESRLYAFARGGGPFMQRVLAYERGDKDGDKDGDKAHAIFEAPAGSPLGERRQPLSTRLAIRLLKRLARAIAPLHASERSHGALGGTSVLLDERGHPTVLVCGLDNMLGGIGETPSPADDVQQIMRVVCAAVVPEGDAAAQDAALALIDSLLRAPSAATRESLLAMPRGDAEDLHSFAEAMELLLLQEKQGVQA